MTDVQYLEVNGARLAYQHWVGRNGHRPMVFLHGYSLQGTGPIYADLFRALSDQFDIYALDMRGHGSSAQSYHSWSQAALADDAVAFARELGLEDPVCAGHSIGGFTAMFAQIRHPGTFSALFLLATAAAEGGVAPENLADHFTQHSQDHGMMRETFAPMYVAPTEAMLDLSAAAVAVIPTPVHIEFYANYGNYIISDQLHTIEVPVLLVNGALETVVELHKQNNTARGLAKCKEVIFSNQGHMLPLELPVSTAREMINFCRDDIPEIFA